MAVVDAHASKKRFEEQNSRDKGRQTSHLKVLYRCDHDIHGSSQASALPHIMALAQLQSQAPLELVSATPHCAVATL